MKSFNQFLAIILTLSSAHARTATRGLLFHGDMQSGGGHGMRGGRGHGGGSGMHGGGGYGMHSGGGQNMNGGRGKDLLGHGPPSIEEMQDQCEGLTCPSTIESLDCSIPRLEIDARGMTPVEKQEAWEVAKEERHRQILTCGCCTEATFEELLERGGYGMHSGEGHGYGMHEGGGRGHGMHGGGGFRQNWMHPSIEDMQAECEGFDCPADTEGIDCNIAKPDVDVSGMTEEEKYKAWDAAKEQRHQQMLRCGCCTEATFEELLIPARGGWHQQGQFMHGNGKGGLWHNEGHPSVQDLQAECESIDCPADTESIDCVIAKPNIDVAGMTQEEKRKAWQAASEQRHQQILSCGCCTDKTFESMLPWQGGENHQGFGMHQGGMHGGNQGELFGGGRPSIEDLEARCEGFACPSNVESISCDDIKKPKLNLSGTVTAEAKREAWRSGKALRDDWHHHLLSCGCCTDASFEDLLVGSGFGTGDGSNSSSSPTTGGDGSGALDRGSDGGQVGEGQVDAGNNGDDGESETNLSELEKDEEASVILTALLAQDPRGAEVATEGLSSGGSVGASSAALGFAVAVGAVFAAVV